MKSTPITLKRRWSLGWRRVRVASRRAPVVPIITGTALIAFVVAIISTWWALQSHVGKGGLLPSGLTATLLVGALVPSLTLLVLLGRWIAIRRAAETIGGSGRLHVQLVFLFSIIAAIPTLLVVIFASVLFQSGVEFWFSDNSRGLLENANKLAQGYYEQTQRDVSNETIAMSSDLRYILGQTAIISPEFAESFSYQVLQRKLDEVAILQKGADGRLRTAAIVDRRAKLLVAAIVMQGAIGYIQYFTGVPPLLVLLHVAGSVVVWLAVLAFDLDLTAHSVERAEDPVLVP